MSTWLSLHIGLNRLDPQVYGGPYNLRASENDALAMSRIATERGFSPTVLLSDQATSRATATAIVEASRRLSDGDYFFLTYSGHGGQVQDREAEEPDSFDETWCLYDGQVLDDMLYSALCLFASGVRVFVMSDSCHSGSVTKDIQPIATTPTQASTLDADADSGQKFLPLDVTDREFKDHQESYKAFDDWWRPSGPPPAISNAAVVLVSGCKDDEKAADGDRNSAFTTAFLEVWNNGGFDRNFRVLLRKVSSLLAQQTPQLYPYGTGVENMMEQVPLSNRSSPWN